MRKIAGATLTALLLTACAPTTRMAERGLAAVIVTHNNQLAALADQPLELVAGKLRSPER